MAEELNEEQLQNPYDQQEEPEANIVKAAWLLVIDEDGAGFVAPLEALQGGIDGKGNKVLPIVPMNTGLELPLIRQALLTALEDIRNTITAMTLAPTIVQALEVNEKRQQVERMQAKLAQKGIHIPPGAKG